MPIKLDSDVFICSILVLFVSGFMLSECVVLKFDSVYHGVRVGSGCGSDP